MSNTLLPCPCCNGKAETSAGGFGPVNAEEVLSLFFVQCTDCGLIVSADTLEEAIRLWNCRFVCPDKNDKKVYAGDKVKFRVWDEAPPGRFKLCRVVKQKAPYHGYGLVGDTDFWTGTFTPEQIELIESDGE